MTILYGSLAVLFSHSSPTAAIARIADILERIFEDQILNVCSHQ